MKKLIRLLLVGAISASLLMPSASVVFADDERSLDSYFKW